MKKKLYILFSVLFVGILVVSVGATYAAKNTVQVPSTVLSTQKVTVSSNDKLRKSSIENGWIYVMDDKGNKVDVKMDFRDDFAIQIDSLKAGTYKVYVDKRAFTKANIFTKDKIVQTKVVDKITSIESDKDLVDYFSVLRAHYENTSIAYDTSGVDESAKSDSASGAKGDHSTTNNQVEGIDEADMTLTDGKTIYTVSQQKVLLIDATNPTNMNVQSTISFKENQYVDQLLLHNNYLIVSFSEYNERYEKQRFIYESFAKLGIYDVTDKANPKLVRAFGHEGNLIALRKKDEFVYLVTQSTPDFYHILDADELKPTIYDSEGEEVEPIDTKAISILPNSEEPTYTTISVIDLSNGISNSIETESYLGSSSGFYMSHEALYLTVGRVDYPSWSNRMMIDMIFSPTETTIYRFAINKQKVEFSGMATIAGGILNQFSMDEHNKYFRVAITSGNTRGDNADSTSAIHIFDNKMNEVGKVSDLAKGERIYSARFMGDKAYVVTFKETDPLFTFDLSNPREPKVLGELKIPGFSTYLHPIGENHLLGLGYETSLQTWEDTNQSFVQREGLKLSLFNVEDLNNPIEQDVAFIGGQGTYSPAIDNHKAFFIHNGKHYYGFPVILYDYKAPQQPYLGQGAMLFEVTADQGIQVAANLVKPSNKEYEEWEETVQRIVYSGNTLYLVAFNNIQSYDLTTFEPLNQIYFK